MSRQSEKGSAKAGTETSVASACHKAPRRKHFWFDGWHMCTCTFRSTSLNSGLPQIASSNPQACPCHVAGHSSILHRISWLFAACKPNKLWKAFDLLESISPNILQTLFMFLRFWWLWKGFFFYKNRPYWRVTRWASNVSCIATFGLAQRLVSSPHKKGVQCWLRTSLLLLVIVWCTWSMSQTSPCLPSGQVKTPWPFRWITHGGTSHCHNCC